MGKERGRGWAAVVLLSGGCQGRPPWKLEEVRDKTGQYLGRGCSEQKESPVQSPGAGVRGSAEGQS